MILTETLIKNMLAEILFNKRLCESAEDNSIVNYLYEALLLEKLLYGEPINIWELKKLLKKQILDFEFIKLDGSIRTARGTTDLKYVPKQDWPKGTAKEATKKRLKKVATFFDLKKKDWRSASIRSKEIVIKKDINTQKPVVVIVDQPDSKEKEKDLKKVPTPTKIEVSPTKKTVTGQPPVPPKPEFEPTQSNQKFTPTGPIKDTRKLLHFRNSLTGAVIDYNVNQTEADTKLKALGKNWSIISEDDLKEHQQLI